MQHRYFRRPERSNIATVFFVLGGRHSERLVFCTRSNVTRLKAESAKTRAAAGHLVAGAGQEALDGDGASRCRKRGLHHAAHEGVDQRRGNLPPPLHLLQDLRTDASSEAPSRRQVQFALPPKLLLGIFLLVFFFFCLL